MLDAPMRSAAENRWENVLSLQAMGLKTVQTSPNRKQKNQILSTGHSASLPTSGISGWEIHGGHSKGANTGGESV